jgi:dodecin
MYREGSIHVIAPALTWINDVIHRSLIAGPRTFYSESYTKPRSRASKEETMADPIYKIVEVVGTSEQSISKAIDNAISKASGTLRNLGWFEVGQLRGDIKDGKVNRYQATLKVGFTLE